MKKYAEHKNQEDATPDHVTPPVSGGENLKGRKVPSWKVFEKLIQLAAKCGIKYIAICDFTSHAKGLLYGDSIGISNRIGMDGMAETMAHEIAHYYLHYDKGDTVGSENHAAYEEQADRAAKMLLDALGA